jgi:acyl-CoA thioesterase
VATLDELMTPARTGDTDHYRFDVPDGWQQGRGAFGGLVFGAMIRAMGATLGDHTARLRTLTGELPAPTDVGVAAIEVEILRKGSAMTTIASRVVQDGKTRAHAVGVFGRARAPVHWQTERPPQVAAWQDIPAAPADALRPPFARHFEYRVIGPYPLSRGAEAKCTGWIRPREPGPGRDAAFVAACADAYWPAAFSVLAEMRPMATVAFTLELIEPLDELDPEAPLLHRATAPAAVDGFTYETRELWGADGRLVARNHQVLVVIK